MLSEPLTYIIIYFVIGYFVSRYNVRTSKRIAAAGGQDAGMPWKCRPIDFWLSVVGLWPVFYILFTAKLNETLPDRVSMSSWLVCAREPKQVRRRERLKKLKAENDAKEKELLNAL
jgi:hypothetical protein